VKTGASSKEVQTSIGSPKVVNANPDASKPVSGQWIGAAQIQQCEPMLLTKVAKHPGHQPCLSD
jgi:hypothetical protein